jgi:hypothetical protein
MEETSKSTTAAEGDDRDQKLPAELKSSSKGSAWEESNRDAKRNSGRSGSGSGSSVPGAQALTEAQERRLGEKSDRNTKRDARAT